MLKAKWIPFLSLMLAAGCATTMIQASLSPQDFAIAEVALVPGSATITGSALIRQSGGGVVTCAGSEVSLIPATESGSRELAVIFGGENGYVRRGGTNTLGGGTVVMPPEPRRTVLRDAQGFFTFDDVQPGEWHVMTSVIWEIGESYQGGTMLSTTEVEEGGEADLVLSY